MLLKIAWRNIWRNKVRSLVVIISISLGILAGLVLMAFSVGMNNTRTRDMLNTYISHIQIHAQPYKREAKVAHFIKDPESLKRKLKNEPDILNYSMRTLSSGMASSANAVQGVMIQGVDPDEEASVTSIHEKIVAGNYFEKSRRNPVVIGKALSKKLKVDINNKIILTFQDRNNDIVTAAFRINGIYKTANSKYDEAAIFVNRNDLQSLLGDSIIHQVAIITAGLDHVDNVKEQLKIKTDQLAIEGWKEVSPDLGYADDMMATSLYIFITIILLAMAFGILNTMLMAVLERTRELGMLMAIGLNKFKVFLMVMYETIMLSLVAGPSGLLLSYWLNNMLANTGIDLSTWGQGMESFGISAMVYPELETQFYFTVSLMVIIMAILSAIYPAYKAVKLKPTESMRTI